MYFYMKMLFYLIELMDGCRLKNESTTDAILPFIFLLSRKELSIWCVESMDFRYKFPFCEFVIEKLIIERVTRNIMNISN